MTTIQTQPYLGKRIGATIIDYIVIIVFCWTYIMVVGEPNEEGGKTVTGLPALAPIAFWFCWLVIPESLGGVTLGHYLTGLKVVSIGNNKPVFWQALVRRIFDMLDISCSLGLVAFILVQTSKHNQRLGDMIAKTLVVEKNFQTNKDFDFENISQNQ